VWDFSFWPGYVLTVPLGEQSKLAPSSVARALAKELGVTVSTNEELERLFPPTESAGKQLTGEF
jgi:hypothetical protein